MEASPLLFTLGRCMYVRDRSVKDDQGKVVGARVASGAIPLGAGILFWFCLFLLHGIFRLEFIVESPLVPEAFKYRPWAGLLWFAPIPNLKEYTG